MRFGVTFAFGLSYFGNQEYFESIYLSTVFGICNIFARSSTVAAPMVAEVVPEPIITITILSFVAAIFSTFLRPRSEGDFHSSGKKGEIAFVEGHEVEPQDLNRTQEKKPSDNGMEEIKKELFLLEGEDEEEDEEEDEDEERNSNNFEKSVPSYSSK